jgi:hypothetical protein
MQNISPSEILKTRPPDYWALWFVALISLALNVWLINGLLVARRQAAQAILQAAEGVSDLRASAFETTVRIDQSIPINLSVPINQTLTVPIDTQLPVSAIVQVPIEVPLLGTQIFDVPINTTIPIKFETQLPVNITVPISASIPVELSVPVKIEVANTPLNTTLLEAEAALGNFAQQLSGNPLAAPTAQPTP